jgi:hypothetical protein
MSVLYTDTFVAADANPIGGNWTTVTGLAALRRLSNACLGSSASDNAAYVNTVTPPNDQYAKSTIGTAVDDGGAAVRISTSAATFYFADSLGSGTQLWKAVAGAFSSIGSSATTCGVGTVAEVRAIGTTISLWKDGVSLVSTTDSSIASGRFGIFVFANVKTFTGFEGGDFLSGAVAEALWAQSCL